MRLLYFSRDFTTHDLRFVRAFVAHGMEVFYLRLENDGVPYVREPLPPGARWVQWPAAAMSHGPHSRIEDLLPALRHVIAEVRPDLVHAGPVQTCGLLAALARTGPTSVVSWGSDILVDANRSAANRSATATALAAADFFLCDSPAVLRAAQRFAPLSPDRTLAIPWGLELEQYDLQRPDRSALRRALGWDDCVVALSTRAWLPGYAIVHAVDAFARASSRQMTLRLALVGAGPDAPQIERRIHDLGVSNRIRRPGMLDATALKTWLQAADVYLATPPSDGTSISLLEAMLYALPVVVTDNPGNREWVVDGVNGFLVDADDDDARADRLATLAADPAARDRMGRAGRSVVLERADWSRNIRRLLERYERLVGAPQAAPTPP